MTVDKRLNGCSLVTTTYKCLPSFHDIKMAQTRCNNCLALSENLSIFDFKKDSLMYIPSTVTLLVTAKVPNFVSMVHDAPLQYHLILFALSQ